MRRPEMQEGCCVCGEALDEENVARCTICEKQFHLAWSTQAPVKNCGRVWVDERICAMRFMCENCAKEHLPSLGAPPGP